MLKEEKCKNIYNNIIRIRENWEVDPVETHTHALYGFTFIDSDAVCEKICDGSDVYALMRKARENKVVDKWSNIALYTEGWAAPHDSEGLAVSPLKHSKSKRVKLVCIVTREYMVVESVMTLENEDTITYDARGWGELADSLLKLYSTMKENHDNHNSKSYYI